MAPEPLGQSPDLKHGPANRRQKNHREPQYPDIYMTKRFDSVCYLCGNAIDRSSRDAGMKLSNDHIPPKQFFPQLLRKKVHLNLDVAPSHKKCNNAYKDDEDYFYHSLYPLVANSNPRMAKAIFSDFMRRRQRGQTPAILRKIFSSASGLTKGGIILPAGRVEILIDEARIQRIAGKIARGVLFLSTRVFFAESSIVDMRLCEEPSEVPDWYQLSWGVVPARGAYPKVFSYRHLPLDDHHILSLLFWEAFMFCITIQGAKVSV